MKVAFVSGKGGSGKSSITAAMVALTDRVVAIDCDVDASNLPLLFPHSCLTEEPFISGTETVIDSGKCTGCGICAERCAFNAISMDRKGIATVDPILCEGCGICSRLCPADAVSIHEKASSRIYTGTFAHGILVHGDLYPGDDNSGKMIARLREIADQTAAETDISTEVLDGPPGIGCPVLSTITGMDKVVIVCEPSLSGISDLKRMLAVARSYCSDISIIINKCDISPENCLSIKEYCRDSKLPVVAELPFDRKLVEAQINCETIITYAPDCPCAVRIKEAYGRIFCS